MTKGRPNHAALSWAAAIIVLCASSVRGVVLYVGSGIQYVYSVGITGGVNLFKSVSSQPFGLAFDRSGNVFVATYDCQILKISSDGAVSVFATLPSDYFPYGLAFDNSGNLYAADYGVDKISKITANGEVSLFATLPAAGGFGQGPAGLAFDSDGNLFVAAQFTGSIFKLTSGGALSTLATLGASARPYGLALDSANNVYVADFNPALITKIDPFGTQSLYATLPAGTGPQGLAFDTVGNLYVAGNNAGTISRVTPDGTVTIIANVSQPEFLAFPVPEATAGILLSGGSLVLATACRRRGRDVWQIGRERSGS